MKRGLGLAAGLVLLAILAVSGERIQAQESKRDHVTIPCTPQKCRMLERWNEGAGVEGERYENLLRLHATLIADPPGLVRSLDREQTLGELVRETEQLTKIYREMLELERK